MSDNQKGIGEKLVEAGISSVKAGSDEIKTTVSTAIGQVTGQPIKTDQELQQIAAHDKESSGKRIDEIQQELAKQKMRRFQEVSNWQTPSAPTPEPNGPEIPQSRQAQLHQSSPSAPQPAESVRQAVGKSELGRNFKG